MRTIKIQNKFWLIFIAIALVAFFVPNIIQAADDGGTISSWIGQAIGRTLFYLFFWPFILLLKVEMLLLPIVAQYNNFTNQAGVQAGWIAARDLVNMLFIVVLLVMAFGTILKIQNYGYRQMLRRLIIMAILVNFSRTLVGVVIDLFQVIMLTMVSAWKDVVYGNVTAALGLDELVKIAGSGPNESGGDVVGQIVLGYLLGGIMVVIASIVLMAFIVILVARIVMLWIIIVISPIAFLANTLPRGESYFQRWVDMLTKELLVGPMLAFFLWLTFMIVGSGKVNEDFVQGNLVIGDQTKEEADAIGQIGITGSGGWENILKYIVGIAMLVGSLKVTQTFGAAAGAVGSKLASGMKSKVSAGYRRVGKTMVAGSSGYGGAVALAGKAGAGLGASLQKTGIKPLVSAGIAFKAAETERAKRHEAGKFTTKWAEKNISNPEDRQKFYEGRPGYRYNEYKTRVDNNNVFDKDKNTTIQGHQDNLDMVNDVIKEAQRVGDGEMIKKVRSTNAMAHSISSDGKNSAEAAAKEQGLAAFNNIDPETLFDHEGNLNEGGRLVVEQFKNFKAGEQQKFLSAKTRTTQDRWNQALIAHANKNLFGTAEENTGKEKADRSLLVRNNDGSYEVNQDHQAYKLSSVNSKAMSSVLEEVNKREDLNPDHEMNNGKSVEEKEIIANRREATLKQFAPQLARNIKDDDLLEMKDSPEDQRVIQAIAPYLPLSKVNAVAERGGNEERTKMVIEAQVKAGNNIEALATNVATRQYVKAEDVAASFKNQINMVKIEEEARVKSIQANGGDASIDEEKIKLEQKNRRNQLAKNNLQFAGEAFGKINGSDANGNQVRLFANNDAKREFAQFVNTLSSTQALKIDKSDLEAVFSDLSETMQNSLKVSGIGGQAQGGRIVAGTDEAFRNATANQNRNSQRSRGQSS